MLAGLVLAGPAHGVFLPGGSLAEGYIHSVSQRPAKSAQAVTIGRGEPDLPVRLYEAMYIVRPDVGDAELEELMGRVTDTVSQIGGTIERHEVWDRRELAYEIDHCTRGTYVICYLNADSQNIHALRRELELEEQILRSVIVLANPAAIWKPMSEEPEVEEAEEELEEEEIEDEEESEEEEDTESEDEGDDEEAEEQVEEIHEAEEEDE